MESTASPSGRRWEKRQLVLAGIVAVFVVVAVLVVLRTGLMATLQAIVLTLREAGPESSSWRWRCCRRWVSR